MAEPDPFDAVLNQLAVQRQTVDRQYTPDDPFKALNRDFADDAQAKAIGSVTADPNKAAKNLQLSTDSGFDPSVVAGDPKGVEIGQKANQASEYVGKNRYLQSYVRKHENYAEISNDDWEKLDEVSKMFAASGLIDVPGIGTVVASQKLAKQLPGGGFINGIYQGIKNLYEVKPKEA